MSRIYGAVLCWSGLAPYDSGGLYTDFHYGSRNSF